VDHRIAAVKDKRARTVEADGAHAQIDLRRSAAIERQLGATITFAQCEGGIVEVGEADGAFELEGAPTREKDDGDMRGDPIDLYAGRAVARSIGQERDHLSLIVHAETLAVNAAAGRTSRVSMD